ncbi:sensor histidine kinase [Amycolatopsis sp. BJA-103]|uniref:sensor histidine kinase n=1 Tax=unclassified Amycolatopsis TaxID=2618356 RepID=UPI000C78E478|nr:sensor histidine kinase [Amycolatopsis sp. BJA-103]AUI61439.1 two-component sensor histidine kinase [Amycolatopsis sp. BJA-103]PNE21267.1 two-component sensor histidine kinase [Amycolatopsis sp. BJA-103]
MAILRRYTAELAITVAVLASSVAVSLGASAEQPRNAVIGWICVVLACAALFLRRRHPLPVAIFTAVCCAIYYPYTDPDGFVLLAFAFALYNNASTGRIRSAAVVAAASMGGVAFGEARAGASRQVDNFAFLLMAGWFIALVAVGAVTYYRREAERTKESEAQRRATGERLRIARELHDVLGHNLALINVQAGAALHGKDPAKSEEALVTIKQTSKDALRELRSTLGMLRQVDTPSLARVAELAESAGAHGLTVRTEIDGTARDLPPDVEHAAFRVVQEALTNVARHAAADTVVVRIGYTDHDVSVQIDDDGRGGAAKPGNGIRGMAERAEALGGEFAAAAREDGGFRVRARLPLRAAR